MSLGYVPDSNDVHTNTELPSPQLLYAGPRGIAIRVLSRAESSDSYVDKLLEQELRNEDWEGYDRALLIELVYGTLRWQQRLDWVLTGFYHGEFTKCITPVKNAMRVALYQMLMLSKIPPSVAINESVAVVRRIKDEKSAHIIAGVLKNILRNIEGIRYPPREENIQLFYSVTLAHPIWMVKRWCERYGDDIAGKILTGNNDRPAIHLRVNTTKAEPEQISDWLKEHDISFEVSPFSPLYFRINGLQNVESMEIYTEGKVARMDAAAYLILRLADIQPGQTVIDLGAVNGMKALACAEMMNNSGQVIAVAKYDEQLKHLWRHSERLGLNCIKTVSGDPVTFSNGEADVIIAEAPSSELGLLQRKPDIKWRCELDIVRKNINAQRTMMESAARSLKPGGVLLYTVASFEPEETTENITWFLEKYPDFHLDDASAYLPESVCSNGCLQTFPYAHRIDGVFAARLVRQK